MDENKSKTVEFSRVFFAPWIKGRISVDYRMVTTQTTNSIGGFIPIGTNEQSIPLSNIGSVSVTTRPNLKSILIGLVAVVAGVMFLGSDPIIGLLLALIGVALVGNGINSYITINRAGNPYVLRAAFYSKKALTEIKTVIDQALIYTEEKQDLGMFFDKK